MRIPVWRVYTHAVKTQVATLIALKGIRVGAMWALLLFSSFIADFFKTAKNTPQDYARVFETLVYVIERLRDDLAECSEGNSFDWYDSMIMSGQKLGYDILKQILLKQHMTQAWDLLHKNNIISNYLLKEELESSLRPNLLFMHNFGMYRKLKEDFQNRYNLKIIWKNTNTILLMAWQNARYLNWKKTNLLHVKSYYKSCYDFLKIILFRLSLKHINYLEFYILDVDRYMYYVQEWHNIVTQFGTLLHLSEDLHVCSLQNCLRNLINGVEKIDSVVNYIASILVELCQPFGCDAIKQFTIDNKEFTIKYRSLTEEEIESLQIPFSPVWIEYYSLGNAKTFLAHLKLAFKNVNFNAIRSLTEYINEINLTFIVEKSENNIEVFENFQFDIPDFDYL
ncbi:uncharacterized protein LOC126843598 isoform X2 [Adelges cooleyi]|uniref:uncharacterized protein LOC126843598 isoform X2 n=1 Tax=Adelges cooleyi TaxID=133065 RepID=UPI00218025DC|nr:uncharacterized protein LOC126843598 isoform X2 [Adelges cooleyi]